MQAVCDAQCRFIALNCNHVGSTNAAESYAQESLIEKCEEQLFPHHWIGKHAYKLSDTMMRPWPGKNNSNVDPCLDWFNHHLSDLKIIIDQTFAMFIGRWGIFWQPLKYGVLDDIKIVHACSRLHNFCINRSVPIITTHHNPAHLLPLIPLLVH